MTASVSSLLAVVKDVALDALERREPVAWLGGPTTPARHHGDMLIALPVPGSLYWAVRRRDVMGHGHWFFTEYTPRSLGTRSINSRRLLWTMQRVQGAIVKSLAIIPLEDLPDSATAPLPPWKTIYAQFR